MYLSTLVSHALELPLHWRMPRMKELHWRMPRMKARWFMEFYQQTCFKVVGENRSWGEVRIHQRQVGGEFLVANWGVTCALLWIL
ncbi:hypothetical protein SLE2022_305730 [Rubroshorea leprosula]